MTGYDPEARGYCSACGTGLSRADTCPWPECPDYGQHAGPDDRAAPGLPRKPARKITRDEAARLIYAQTGSMTSAYVPLLGAPAGWAPPARSMRGEDALAHLDRLAWLEYQRVRGELLDVEIVHRTRP